MRISLLDLIIEIVLMAGGVFAVGLIFKGTGVFFLCAQVAIGFVCYLLVSSPLYRLLSRRPLLLPRCPKCHDSNRHYFSRTSAWPFEIIQCAHCETFIELVLDRSSDREHSADRPHLEFQYQLLWPYSFGGRWRRVNSA